MGALIPALSWLRPPIALARPLTSLGLCELQQSIVVPYSRPEAIWKPGSQV